MKELNFYMRYKDYGFIACPEHLVRLSPDEKNTTIDFVKYYQHNGRESCYSIGYFRYDDYEDCWDLRFVGDRFTKIPLEDVPEVWAILKLAYEALSTFKMQNDE